MQPLERGLRSILADVISKARDSAEAGAWAALEQLAVHEAAAYPHLDAVQRDLRKRLRIHGRGLGDNLNGGKNQTMDRLVEEVAYEHWHRMLFARFLAENSMLMYPDPEAPVPVTLAECEELAEKEGAANGWELAARFASRMLPQIFRLDSPVFSVALPPEHQQALTHLVTDLPVEVFTASDSLGWVYQYWQSKRKDEVNSSEVKIGARELPAVTQLFTEPYMVSFLLDNSLGAWWAGRRLSEADLRSATTEQELRAKAALPGVPLQYLRFVHEDGAWTPAAGVFSLWPEHLHELRAIDPCCGSGHFLVAAFQMLVPLRIQIEGLSPKDAVDRVLTENLHGLDIDRRVTEIAAFALAMAAWRFPGAGGYRPLPPMNVACSGLALNAAREDWEQIAGEDQNLKVALGWMHDAFKDAPIIGSLLNPRKSDAARLVEWNRLSVAIEQAMAREQTDEQREAAVTAQGMARSAAMLHGHYHWVITNVPYLARGSQCDRLQSFSISACPNGKTNLATVFLNRCLDFCNDGGTTSIVLPQNWLFLTSYRQFREQFLKSDTWHLIARLGPAAFQTPMYDYNIQLLLMSRGNTARSGENLFDAGATANLIRGLDVSDIRTPAGKAEALVSSAPESAGQSEQLENPDARVMTEPAVRASLLANVAKTGTGLQTFDSPRFLSYFWERPVNSSKIQIFCQSCVKVTQPWGGLSQVLRWQNGSGDFSNMMADKATYENYKSGIWKAWTRFVGSRGICVNLMGSLAVSLYAGAAFDNNMGVISPDDESTLPAIWCFCSSPEYHEAVRRIDQKLNVTNATLVKVPFDLERWTKVAQEKCPNGLPQPYSDDPAQWIFHGNPAQSEEPLQVAVARLLGYRWPAELDSEMELSEEARVLIKRSEALASYADKDGIVCIPPVRGEMSAADRVMRLLVPAFNGGPEKHWTDDTLAQLLSRVGYANKTLESWLRDSFFAQHCKLFRHRPFIWHIWDGLRDGFGALVNYHKLDGKLLETLIYTYLGDWISRQKQNIAAGVDGSEEKLAAAEALKSRLELILKGESPYDIFVRWKPLAEQPIGWAPDLNDGVRLNIRPFMSVPDIGRKGAGVLRDKPNIDWGKDRGKDVETAPWFKVFEGERLNDHHLKLEEKRATRKS